MLAQYFNILHIELTQCPRTFLSAHNTEHTKTVEGREKMKENQECKTYLLQNEMAVALVKAVDLIQT